jgi:hypothetical protein
MPFLTGMLRISINEGAAQQVIRSINIEEAFARGDAENAE